MKKKQHSYTLIIKLKSEEAPDWGLGQGILVKQEVLLSRKSDEYMLPYHMITFFEDIKKDLFEEVIQYNGVK